jgi:agmatine deiminase
VSTPRQLGFSQPAEWAPHDAVWLAWPSHADLWGERLPEVQREVVALCEAIADLDPETGTPRGERLDVIVRDDEGARDAGQALARLGARFHRAEYGDIWLRDTAPIFLTGAGGTIASVRFTFNGWGGKYVLAGDAELAAKIQAFAGHGEGRAFSREPFVLEGGAVEVDGEGTVLTTRQCLLHPNRNLSLTQSQIEHELCEGLGAERVLWLGEGLLNDHTDGHVDTIARFVAPGVVVCMHPSGPDDPNAAVLEATARDLAAMVDARGRRIQVVSIPSPGRVVDEEGRVMPASHVNFYVGNTTVVVPVYGTPWDEAAVRALEPLFPGRRVVGRSARAILDGGGAFHCITQQQPAGAPSAGGAR